MIDETRPLPLTHYTETVNFLYLVYTGPATVIQKEKHLANFILHITLLSILNNSFKQ
jgi:hypothetical protein